MNSSAPSPTTVLDVFDTLGSPGIPLTTTEVADEFECTDRTIYNKLDALVDEGAIETKKVGARGRVWWRPPPEFNHQHEYEVNPNHPDKTGSFPDSFGTNFPSDSEMAKQIREMDWAETALGPTDDWPQQLRIAVDIMLSASEAIGIYWGSEHTLLYNDAWRDLIGDKHPDALGRPGQEVFPEIWDIVGPMFERIMSGSGAIKNKEQLMPLERGDQIENAWFDYTANPIPMEDGSVGGIFNIALEVTSRKKTKEAMRKQAELDAFSVALTDELRSLADPVEIQHEAARILGEHLDVDRAHYGEVLADGNTNLIHADFYHGGGSSLVGEHLLDDFGEYISDAFRADDTVVIDDVRTVSDLSDEERATTLETGTSAGIGIPFVKDGQLTAYFIVTHTTSREWTETEIAMAEETAERTWAAVERARAEQALRESEERYRTLFESIDEGFCVIEKVDTPTDEPIDFRFVEVNSASTEQSGVENVVGKTIREIVPSEPEDWIETYDSVVQMGESIRFERELKSQGRFLELYAYPVEGDVNERVGVLFQDITDRKRTQCALEQLNEISRELMKANTQEINDQVTDITRRILGVEYSALWHYDEMTGELQQDTSTIVSEIEDGAIQYPDGFSEQIWQSFISDDPAIHTDLSPLPNTSSSESLLQSNALIPLGRHGVLYAGSTDADMFDETTIDFTKTLAATFETALDRAEGEQQLEQQNKELAHLDQLYSLMWEIDQALVQAGTVESIDRAVCEQLADSDLFEFAWIGEFDAIKETVEPRQWDGIDSRIVEDRTISIDDNVTNQNPVGAAAHTHKTQIVADIATDRRIGSCREAILKQGARSCLSIPLIYKDALYGTLTVYAAQPKPNERTQCVLEELGRTVAHAINAAQKQETIQTDSVVELTIQVQEPGTVLARLARDADVQLQFKGIVPNEDSSSYVFFTGSQASGDEIQTTGSNLAGITTLTRVAEDDETCLFRATVSGSTLISQLTTQKSAVRTLTFDKNTAVAIVDLPSTIDVRSYIDMLQHTHPSAKLTSRHSRNRSPKSVQDVSIAIKEPLTDRQTDILKLAYLSGFFESPRASTGQEIAAMLDVTPPTFSQHLRAAQQKVFALAFDEE